jgi:hypothetical protein
MALKTCMRCLIALLQERDDTLTQQFRLDESWRYGLLGLLIDAMRELAGKNLEMPDDIKQFTDAYMLENNPVGAWLRQFYDITGNREDYIQKTELYRQFLQDTGLNKTQKSFCEDILKCNINDKQIKGIRQYFGIIRKKSREKQEEAGFSPNSSIVISPTEL